MPSVMTTRLVGSKHRSLFLRLWTKVQICTDVTVIYAVFPSTMLDILSHSKSRKSNHLDLLFIPTGGH